MVELPRKRYKVSEVWRDSERKENYYRSGDPVPSGKWANWGAQRMLWEREGRGTRTLGYREGGNLGSAGAFGARQAEVERQERMPRARGALGWVGSDPSRALVAAGGGGQEVGGKRGAEASDKWGKLYAGVMERKEHKRQEGRQTQHHGDGEGSRRGRQRPGPCMGAQN